MKKCFPLFLLCLLLPGSICWLPAAGAAQREAFRQRTSPRDDEKPVLIQDIAIPGIGRRIAARKYFVRRESKQAGLLLLAGIAPGGIDEKRLQRFAKFLARQGFVVLTPSVAGALEMRLAVGAVDDVVTSFQYLTSKDESVDPSRIGIWGICIGGGYGLTAAGRAELRGRVKFVTAHDAYFDLSHLMDFLFTGRFEFGDQRGRTAPTRYARAVAFKNYLYEIYDGADRDCVMDAVDLLLDGKDDAAGAVTRRLSAEGQFIVSLITSEDPPEGGAMARAMKERRRAEAASISPSAVIEKITCPVYLVHSRNSAVVPFTETLELEATLRKQGTAVKVLITDVLDHVTFNETGMSFDAHAVSLAREVIELSTFINALIKFAR